jgi:4-carboxymuconolactone decarboxylase
MRLGPPPPCTTEAFVARPDSAGVLSVPRIPPLAEPDWPEQLRSVLDARPPALGSRLGDNNIFSTLARHEDLFRAWLRFGGFLLGGGVLPARERELLILRTGHNCGCAYEWGQHVRIAEALGMDRAEIVRVADGPQADGWSAADAALLRAADELHERAKISDATWARLGESYDERGLIELTMLVGHYHLVAFALNSLEVDLDDGLDGLPER